MSFLARIVEQGKASANAVMGTSVYMAPVTCDRRVLEG